MYTFWDIPGSKYVSYDRKLSVNYPWTFVVLLEPTSNNLDADFAIYYWFKDNAGVTSAQTIEESIIQETVPITIVKGAEKIEYVSEYKYLGVTITDDLKWKTHIERIAQRATFTMMNCKKMMSKSWGTSPKIIR